MSDRGVEGGEVFGRGAGVNQICIEFMRRGHSYILSLKHFHKGHFGGVCRGHVDICRFLWSRCHRLIRESGGGGRGSCLFRRRRKRTLGSQGHCLISRLLGEGGRGRECDCVP